MKKKALIVSIAILVVIGIFSFVNIFKVGQSFVKHSRFAEGVNDITDASLKKCLNTKLTIAGDTIETKIANFKKSKDNGVLYNADDATDPTSIIGMRCEHSGVSSVAGITALAGLKYLYLEGNAISGAVDLNGMTTLEEIDLSDNPKVTGLTVHTLNMKVFDLDNTGMKNVTDVRIGESPITDRSVLNAKAEVLKFKGMTWDANMKDVILNNASTLQVLSLANTGFNDVSLFASNAELFTALTDINLSNNDLTNVSLQGLKTQTFICDSCNLKSITIDKSVLKELDVPNNQIESFYAYPTDYPALKILNLSGNPLQAAAFDATPSGGATGGVTHLNLSNINLPDFNLAKCNPGSLVELIMNNSNLPSELDFREFSSAFKYLDVSNYSTDEASHPNKVNSIKVTFSSDPAKNSGLQTVIARANEGFNSINLEKPQGEDNNNEPSLPSLTTLDASFTNISDFDFTRFPGIKNLSFVGCKNYNALKLYDTEANPPYDYRNQIESLGIALSGISLDYIPKNSNNLKTIIINSDYPELLHLGSFPALNKIIVVSEKDIYGVTTADSFDTSFLLGAIPQNISDVNAYDVYEGYLPDAANKIDVIPTGKNKNLFLESSNVKVANVTTFSGTIDYNGYFKVSPIKITSQKYKFDTLNNERVIVVGNDENGDILDGVVLSDQDVNKSISEDEKYLVLTKGDIEIARYRLLRVDPGSYNPENPDGGSENLPDDDSSHSSIDPTEEGGSGSGEQYETVDPTATGAFISIVSLVVLVIAGVISQFYMKKKRKEEELIEKI